MFAICAGGTTEELPFGNVSATFNVPTLTGFSWQLGTIPEPASLALLALGGLLAIRRR